MDPLSGFGSEHIATIPTFASNVPGHKLMAVACAGVSFLVFCRFCCLSLRLEFPSRLLRTVKGKGGE